MIACEIHDYVEIACTYRINVSLGFKSGEEITGIAKDTCLNHLRQECIKLQTEVGERVVPLDLLLSMKALDTNPHFKQIVFTKSSSFNVQ